ncbi:MAG: GNAT family N-acetyltransferase [Bacteroidota bacterium]
MDVSLRVSRPSDLELFFLNQTDQQANYLAAFTPKDPMDRAAYFSKWTRLLADPNIHMQSIMVDDQLVGCVVKFPMEGKSEITYAISRSFWGKGITTLAVKKFLILETVRPIFGKVAFDNFGSQKVLEKAGFQKIGTAMGFAHARGKEIEEFIYKLE